MNNNDNAILIGAGHVGKKHAKVLSEIFKNLTIIDPNQEALNWCSQNLNCNVNTFGNLEYYFKGCNNWSWYYPYHYAPTAEDIFKAMELSNINSFKFSL